MQRHKSVEKRARQNKKANVVNRASRVQIKTAVRSVLESNDKSKAGEALREAVSVLDKHVKRGTIHANKAANKKSQLYSHVNKLGK